MRQAVLLSGLCAFAFVGGYLTGEAVLPGGVTPEDSPTVEPGIAVLPFDTWSEEPGDDAFSNTLTHELVAMLTQEGVRVAPSAAVERFKSPALGPGEVSREIPRIAGTLGAAAVVMGTVTRAAGGALLVSIHVFDGERGELLSEIGVNWQGPRTGRRILGEHVVPEIVQTLNRLS